MSFNWQDVAALSIVTLACGYLLRQGWLLVRRKQPSGGCGGGCAKCPSVGGVNVVFGDGSVHSINSDIPRRVSPARQLIEATHDNDRNQDEQPDHDHRQTTQCPKSGPARVNEPSAGFPF
jgi:prepilin-type processing-associated H-X9-DG protein